ncbi:MAG: hypothetical protein WC712_10085 [Candidatus Brocadiia bacterium]
MPEEESSQGKNGNKDHVINGVPIYTRPTKPVVTVYSETGEAPKSPSWSIIAAVAGIAILAVAVMLGAVFGVKWLFSGSGTGNTTAKFESGCVYALFLRTFSGPDAEKKAAEEKAYLAGKNISNIEIFKTPSGDFSLAVGKFTAGDESNASLVRKGVLEQFPGRFPKAEFWKIQSSPTPK